MRTLILLAALALSQQSLAPVRNDTMHLTVNTAISSAEITPCQKLSLLSYNHPTWHLQKAHPGKYFHLEVGGDALIDRYAEVDRVFPGSQLHIEMGYRRPTGMLNGYFESPEQVQAGIAALEAVGVGVHSPHQWFVDRNVELVKATAAKNDPHGLLNPGKLPA